MLEFGLYDIWLERNILDEKLRIAEKIGESNVRNV